MDEPIKIMCETEDGDVAEIVVGQWTDGSIMVMTDAYVANIALFLDKKEQVEQLIQALEAIKGGVHE